MTNFRFITTNLKIFVDTQGFISAVLCLSDFWAGVMAKVEEIVEHATANMAHKKCHRSESLEIITEVQYPSVVYTVY